MKWRSIIVSKLNHRNHWTTVSYLHLGVVQLLLKDGWDVYINGNCYDKSFKSLSGAKKFALREAKRILLERCRCPVCGSPMTIKSFFGGDTVSIECSEDRHHHEYQLRAFNGDLKDGQLEFMAIDAWLGRSH